MIGNERGLPVLALRDSVVFPHSQGVVTIGRPTSLALLEAIDPATGELVMACQKAAEVDEPELSDLRAIGTLARLLEVSHPKKDATSAVAFVAGISRVRLLREVQRAPFLRAHVEHIEENDPGPPDERLQAMVQNVRDLAAEIILRSPALSNDLLPIVQRTERAGPLCDFVAAMLPGPSTEARQALLEAIDVRARMQALTEMLIRARETLRLQDHLQEEVRRKVGRAQRETVLREELKAIKRELGEEDEGERRDVEELEQRLAAADLTDAARDEVERELRRLRQMSPSSPEHNVVRTFLEWVADLPWGRTSAESIDLARAKQVLDEDHHDLERVKERILEYLAVLRLKHDLKGPILCLTGPPGVGKTSLGKSIARALGRRFARISLGGMHDEAEIRGHRRTYVGALPGQIISALKRAGTSDPVIMLDEIDKLGRDIHGDPASALLEVLDSEQNSTFRDHYLDLEFDLSRVLFITTANVTDTIPPALFDRMETIELPGYTEEQKLGIAERFLVPKQIDAAGLDPDRVSFTSDALLAIVRGYTAEAGVRNLEREIGSLCRKHARRLAVEPGLTLAVSPEVVRRDLGPPRAQAEVALEERTREPGVALALAWTPSGGDVLFVEAARLPRSQGQPELVITGHVGEVMRESVVAALSWVRAHGASYGVDLDAVAHDDIHVHVPAGAVAKDGPSAGIAVVTALISLLSRRPVRPYVALTGEITLGGHLLAIGGIKEKVLGARRSHVREVVMPADNADRALDELPDHAGVELHFARTIDDALALALAPAELSQGLRQRAG